jgi:hypothetical protein
MPQVHPPAHPAWTDATGLRCAGNHHDRRRSSNNKDRLGRGGAVPVFYGTPLCVRLLGPVASGAASRPRVKSGIVGSRGFCLTIFVDIVSLRTLFPDTLIACRNEAQGAGRCDADNKLCGETACGVCP